MEEIDQLKLENLDLKLALLQAQFKLVKIERDELAAKLNGKAEEK